MRTPAGRHASFGRRRTDRRVVTELGTHVNNVADATRLVPDARAPHYWGPNEALGVAYGRLPPTRAAAWDVYMLFGPSATWPKSAVPKPDYWMHQVGGVTAAPRLDAGVFASQAASLLGKPR